MYKVLLALLLISGSCYGQGSRGLLISDTVDSDRIHIGHWDGPMVYFGTREADTNVTFYMQGYPDTATALRAMGKHVMKQMREYNALQALTNYINLDAITPLIKNSESRKYYIEHLKEYRKLTKITDK